MQTAKGTAITSMFPFQLSTPQRATIDSGGMLLVQIETSVVSNFLEFSQYLTALV